MNAQDIAYGYGIGYNDGLAASGGGGEDEYEWHIPDWWKPVPDPAPYQVCCLLEATASNKITRVVCDYGSGGADTFIIDWGDGTVDDCSGLGYNRWAHTYAEAGQYVVTVTMSADKAQNFGIAASGNNNPKLLILKVGYGVTIGGTRERFSGYRNLTYVKFFGEIEFLYSDFYHCNRLKVIDTVYPVTKLPSGVFNDCYGLYKFDFSEVTEIEDSIFGWCGIRKVNLPKCTSITELPRYVTEFTADILEVVPENLIYSKGCLKTVKLPACKELGNGNLLGCGNLIFADMPQCEKIGSNCIQDCESLVKVNMPLCKETGDYCFYETRNLAELNIADDCTFGENCFYHCYSYYPRPDGSVN